MSRAGYFKEWYRKNRARVLSRSRSYFLKQAYGVTRLDIVAMTAGQGGRCLMCDSSHNLGLDHCHMTGRNVGMLCLNCNTAIGLLMEDPEIARRAAEYILENK